MSKPSYLREVSGVSFLDDTRILFKHTIIKCSNEANFAKRYRWCLTQKMVECATEMYANVRRANSVFVKTAKDYELRRMFQKKALAELTALTGLIDIAYEVFGKLTSPEIKHWTELCDKARNSLKNWLDNETRKYEGL